MSASTESNAQTGTELTQELSRQFVEENFNVHGTLGANAEWFQLNGVDIFDDEADEIRNFEVIENKDVLIGKQLILASWKFNTSDKFKDRETGEDGSFVSIMVQYLDENGAPKVGILNDGGTGIYRQMEKLTTVRVQKSHPAPFAGKGVRRGLRKSEYQFQSGETKSGEPIMETGVTYYLDF